MELGLVVLRVVVGLLFMGHGAQKLFGSFGGHGLEGTAGFFEQGLGIRPGKVHAAGAGMAEFFGGPQNSLGVFIKSQAAILRTREAWSAIVVACLFGLLFYGAVVLVERVALPWRRPSE